MNPLSLDRKATLSLALLLLATAGLYLLTLDNGLSTADLMGGDLITHQYAQVQARPSNAPGYPLYTMGGWLWFHGLRSLASEANPVPLLSSYSTLWALLALATLFLLLYNVTQANLVITLGLSIAYALTYFFWFYSVTTEQYTSAIFQTLLIVAMAHAWDRDARDGYLYTIAFLFGLALAHLVTVLFVAPGVLIFILSKEPALLKRGKLILKSLLVALIPLLSYAYIYLRGAQHPEWRGAGSWPNTTAWFISFLSTQQGQDELTWTLGPLTDEFPRLIWEEMSIVLLVLGIAGWVLMGRRYTLLYGLTAIIYLVFSYIDRFGNWYQVIMPLYPLILVGAAVTLDRFWRRFPGKWAHGAITIMLIALILFIFNGSYARANQRNRPGDTGLAPGRAILDSDPPADAAIVASVDEKLALDYLTGIWGFRPDIQAVTTANAATALRAGRPLLVSSAAATYAADEIEIPLRYSSWGPGLLLADQALPVPPLVEYTAADAFLGDGLRLIAYKISPGPEAGIWDVQIALKTDQQPTTDWALSVRLLENGLEIAQQDHSAPAEGITPTTTLLAGETVVDAFRLTLDDDSEPDAARLYLYRQLEDGSFDNLAEIDLPQ